MTYQINGECNMAFIDTVTEMEQIQERVRKLMTGVHVVNVDVEKLRELPLG